MLNNKLIDTNVKNTQKLSRLTIHIFESASQSCIS